ncbi:MAG: hypothetical protein E5V72_00995 [Mesorhizobium sp.]|uniref:hypothetical protein n=1 Tax=Mesorhizobium sp. TaxID=1871066 RepID=UPI000FE92740|nr:hypothetical protein [Mesorhizobium sp.]RWI74792.1 MAG: hypothetical protein EOR19_20120 [Mesorhizobium sp.]RWJ33285.1 MAG: hypothetical protein EOR28_11915 [Mesorhizobium sp.]TIQ68284.1 MAG: hypothetical protein E5X40_30175 [Mesorhizobium sp.]TIW50895.1 MAG: hypothetical protein E5V72_00995 [Mesorhizobium sp.]
MSKRNKGIIAYGTEEDRAKLAVLADLTGKTASDWIIREVRKQYEAAFGDIPPERIIAQQ